MTTQYDTQYLNSLSISELEALLEKLVAILVNYHGVPLENMSFLKESEYFRDLTFLTLGVTLH